MFKLSSLNLNGIRSATSKGLEAWIAQARPDCICVQEVRAQALDLKDRFESLAGLKGYFHFAQKKGYSGVGAYTRHEPSDVLVGFGSPEFDAEGRTIELRFDTPARKLSLISAYFPSGSSGEDRQLAKFRFLELFYPYLASLKTKREFILCGDVNIAHQEIDLKNFKGNKKNSGFLPEERAWMTGLLAPTLAKGVELARGGPALRAAAGMAEEALDELTDGTGQPTAQAWRGGGMVDVYRQLQPTATDAAYTWWSNRGQAYAKNVGWRLDYHLATPAMAALAQSETIYKTQRFSDHAPITVDYQLRL